MRRVQGQLLELEALLVGGARAVRREIDAAGSQEIEVAGAVDLVAETRHSGPRQQEPRGAVIVGARREVDRRIDDRRHRWRRAVDRQDRGGRRDPSLVCDVVHRADAKGADGTRALELSAQA